MVQRDSNVYILLFFAIREFMSQFTKEAYDPSYGYFNATSQQLLYPNPDISLIQPDYMKHYHFLGRMLGKVCWESYFKLELFVESYNFSIVFYKAILK